MPVVTTHRPIKKLKTVRKPGPEASPTPCAPPPSAALRPHPLAELFPPLPADEFRALCQDIRDRGQQEPITVFENQILDGLNRWRACREIGIEPITREWDGRGSIEAFVASINLVRRHLTPSQRALIAACWPDAPDAPAGRRRRPSARETVQRCTVPGRRAAPATSWRCGSASPRPSTRPPASS